MRSIVEFATAYADWLEQDADAAAKHGHSPLQTRVLAAGWRFVGEALGEQLDDGSE